jgi:putative FmdB family regulatory protein
MPLYEYQCTACGEVCEVLQKVKDKPLQKCPKCGGAMVKRISSPAIQFKGNGWYITDYAKKSSSGSAPGPKDRARDEGKAPAKAEPSAAPKDGKPAS